MAKLTGKERELDEKNRAYMRNEASLREVYAAADEVLTERGEKATAAARARVINESDKRV